MKCALIGPAQASNDLFNQTYFIPPEKKMTVNSNVFSTYPKAIPTGEFHEHHITRERAPLATLPSPPRGSGGWEGSVTEYAGHIGYIHTDACAETGIFRTALAMDDGENICRKRSAPSSLQGICAGRTKLTLVCTDLIAWVQ